MTANLFTAPLTVADHRRVAHPSGEYGWCVVDAHGDVVAEPFVRLFHLVYEEESEAQAAAEAYMVVRQSGLTQLQHAQIAHAVIEHAAEFVTDDKVAAPMLADRYLYGMLCDPEIDSNMLFAVIRARVALDPMVVTISATASKGKYTDRVAAANDARARARREFFQNGDLEAAQRWLAVADQQHPENAGETDAVKREIFLAAGRGR